MEAVSTYCGNGEATITRAKVRPTDRTRICFTVTRTIRLANVKGQILAKLRIRRDFQRLVYAGKQLEDHLALSTYGITNMSQIHLVRMVNGGGASRIFADISDNSLLHVDEFSLDAPEWRMAYQGLNIEGTCENPLCAAFRELIICPKGYQEFNLMRDDDAKCPMCQSNVIPSTCGFYDCAWKFDGVQADNGNPVISRWKEARGYRYHRFYGDEHCGSVKWESLLIVAKPLDAEVRESLDENGNLGSWHFLQTRMTATNRGVRLRSGMSGSRRRSRLARVT